MIQAGDRQADSERREKEGGESQPDTPTAARCTLRRKPTQPTNFICGRES